MRLHDLWHTTATLLLAQGVHPRVVMETLGYSQVSLTLDTYSHVLPSLQAEAAKRMDEAIGCQIGCQKENDSTDQPQEISAVQISCDCVAERGVSFGIREGPPVGDDDTSRCCPN